MEDNEKLVYTFSDFNDEEIKVFLPKFEIDMGTMRQIKDMSKDLILKHIRIMPDCHRGAGCCVGMTAQIQNRIYPRYVGFDIGCGISIYPFNVELTEESIPVIEKIIQKHVPMGSGEKGKNRQLQMLDSDWDYLREINNADLEFLKVKLAEKYPDYKFPEIIDKDYVTDMIKKIGNLNNDLKSIGTLGGGNHYVEVNKGDSTEKYLTVHSGSRNIGASICKFHQDIIDNNSRFDYDAFKDEMKNVKRKFKDSKIIHEIEMELRNKMTDELHPRYLEDHEMIDYLIDMIVGQNLASLNRIIMIRNVIKNVPQEFLSDSATTHDFDPSKVIETKHNYIDFKRFMLRKGSISAEKGEQCVVSLNMRDGILLCEGKGNPDWNYSSAHGCGRILKRGSVNKLSMSQFREEMKGVYSTSVRKETLDESPMAYRNVDLVKRCLKESVVILKQLKPIINCKGF